MANIPRMNVVIQQQEEHVIYPLTIINTKPEDEHVIAVLSDVFLLSNPKSTNYNDRQHPTKAERILHLTFRIPENVVKALKKEAHSNGVPLSILVNNVLKNHLVQMNTGKTDFILISKDFFRRIFGKIDEKSIGDYGTELGRAIVSEYTSTFYPDIDKYTIVQFLESWFKRFQSYQHRFDEENNRHTFSVNHDINMNFSNVLRIILEGLVEPVIKNKVIFGEITSSCITFTFHI